MEKQDKDKVPKIKREGWKAEELIEESANQESDEIVRKILRGDETKGDPDERDIVGTPNFDDTPRGRREESKKNEKKIDNKP